MTHGLKLIMRYLQNEAPCGPQLRLLNEPTDAGRELLDLLRREAALERIVATGARVQIDLGTKAGHPLRVMFVNEHWHILAEKWLGDFGDPLTADLAEAGQAWAEAQAAPKTCPCCGKRCVPK